MARGAARRVDVVHFQLEQDGLALDVAETDVHVAGEAAPAIAVQQRTGHVGLDTLDEAIAQGGQAGAGGRAVLLHQLERRATRHDAGHVLGAGAATTFLVAPVDEWHQRSPAPDVERAHALGRVELVGGEREEIDPEAVHVEVEEAGGLHGVGVNEDPARAGQPRDLGDGLNRADLVVGEHDADEKRIGANGRCDRGRIDDSPLVDGDMGHVVPEVLVQGAGGAQDRAVLDRRRDEVPLAGEGQRHTLEGEVIALGAAPGEDDLVSVAPEDAGHLGARPL